MSSLIKTIQWKDDKVVMLDQRLLPFDEVYNTYEDYVGVARAIKMMVIRGAPAIGIAAAMGVALGALGLDLRNFSEFYKKIEEIAAKLAATRPTAVNLFWALERMKRVCRENEALSIPDLKVRLKEEAIKILKEDISANQTMGKHGAKLLSDKTSVLTHCNAGALATGGYGTALGVIYAAQEEGKQIHVYADETRPFLQGARLTAWELQKHGIETTVICDNMSGTLMQQGKIDAVIVGADRITANGDVVNKIGTYTVALLCKEHKIPFYVAAPLSTIDLSLATGAEVPIEERDPQEVTHFNGNPVTPSHVDVYNPAFDCTPHHLVTAIISEKGIAKSPFEQTLREWKKSSSPL